LVRVARRCGLVGRRTLAMADLSTLLTSAGLGRLGKDVWLLIGARMDMRSACRFAQTCRAGRALLQVDKHNEVRFRREKSPLSIVEGGGDSWLERFRLAEQYQSLWAAVDAANDMEAVATIVVCPGVYVLEKGWAQRTIALSINKPVHIVGCCFDQNYDCVKPSIRHVEEVPSFGPSVPNIRIICRWGACIGWRAPSGSIRDVCILMETEVDNLLEPALWVEKGGLGLINCSFSSSSTFGVSMEPNTELEARACRFQNCKVAGLSFGSLSGHSSVTLEGCWFDGNGITGVEVTGGSATLTNCVIFGNRFNGLGIGQAASVTVERCNIFDNGLNGVDLLHASATMVECNVERNWCGVRQVVYPNEPMTDVSNCVVSENVHAQHSIVRVSDEEDLVEKADADGICTFLVTGPHFVPHREIFYCFTCTNRKQCICRACRDTCHAGHDCRVVPNIDNDSYYCDCAVTPACKFADRIAQDVIGRPLKRIKQ
jgi:hypothetical protein